MGYPRSGQVAAYKSTAAHGGVAASDPHGLVLMLLDGALQRVAAARGYMQNGSIKEKSDLLHRVVQIVAELQGSLDMKSGGEIANNLAELYDYITRRVMSANLANNTATLDEVTSLLRTLRSAWAEIPAEMRAVQAGAR